MTFDCVICLDKFDGRGTIVGQHRVCDECLVKGIVPKFHAALKYEHHYPPAFGAGATLDPHDFLDFFDDPQDFLQKWEEKRLEYETPYKKRFYCSNGHFLCPKLKDGSTFNIVCFECNAVTCFPCGANLFAQHPPHVCPGQQTDEDSADTFKGLERGKHYQLCPSCDAPVELKDGCNHMVCKAGFCGTNFCFICGMKATANSGHWNAGKACPRYNHPDDGRGAHHDNPELQARIDQFFEAHPAVVERIRDNEVAEDEPELIDDNSEIADADELEENNAPTIDLLWDALGQEEYDRQIEEVVSMVNDVPALPDLTGMTEEQQIEAEQNMAFDLESSSLGMRMRQQKRQLDAMIEVAEARIIEGENEDLLVPEWVYAAITLMTTLRANLDVYIYRMRLRTSLQEFEDRHDSLEQAYGPHHPDIFRNFRLFYEILAPYHTVAEIRILGATAASEGTATEDEVVRQQVAETTEMFVGVRRIQAARALLQLANHGAAGAEE